MSVRSVMPTHCVLCHNKFGKEHQRPTKEDCDGKRASLNLCCPCLRVVCKKGDLSEHYKRYPAPPGYDPTSMMAKRTTKY